ncbi:MAG: hypothetical protein ACR2HP_13020 [Ilumatobacteraceae bacterium]
MTDPLADCRLGRPDGRWTAAECPTRFARGGPAPRRAGVWSGDAKDRPELVDAALAGIVAVLAAGWKWVLRRPWPWRADGARSGDPGEV